MIQMIQFKNENMDLPLNWLKPAITHKSKMMTVTAAIKWNILPADVSLRILSANEI